MKIRKGPRPLPVWTFATVVIGIASWNLGVDLQRALSIADEPGRIAAVSRASAGFLIMAIPASVVWLFASRLAKWFITILAAVSVVQMVLAFVRMTSPDAEAGARFAVGLAVHALVLLLFAPSARRWFTAEKKDEAVVFD